MNHIQRGNVLRISSEDREQKNESNSDFSIKFNGASYIQNVRGLVLKSVSFKHVFPNIFDGNNVFTFIYDGVQTSVSLASAWYDVDTFPLALSTAITAIVGDPVTVLAEISPVGASSKNKKLSFTASAGHTIGLLDSDLNPMALVCGISADVTEALSVTAQWLYDLSGLGQVYLHCEEAGNAVASSKNGEVIKMVSEIPINVDFGYQVFYNARDADLEYINFASERSLAEMAFSLRSRSGNILDLAQHQLVIVFKLVPEKFMAN